LKDAPTRLAAARPGSKWKNSMNAKAADQQVLPYELRSMWESIPLRHWMNEKYYYMWKWMDAGGLSIGMTLEELGKYFIQLGCTEAMNLDGGGSAMFWAEWPIRIVHAISLERPGSGRLPMRFWWCARKRKRSMREVQ